MLDDGSDLVIRFLADVTLYRDALLYPQTPFEN
jgi:hypothetical protein